MISETNNRFPLNDPRPPSPELRLSSVEDLESMSFEQMKALFDENDRKLLAKLEGREVPYFGLHGAAKPALDYHKKFGNDGKLPYDVVTFHDKLVSKRILLNSLYAAAGVSASFAFSGAGLRNSLNLPVTKKELFQGGIEVVNLEHNGKNNSILEKLGGYKPQFPADRDGDVVTARGVIFLSPDNYKQIVKVLSNEDLGGYPKVYSTYLSLMEQEHEANGETEVYKILRGKVVFTEGFLNQKVIEESLKALKVF